MDNKKIIVIGITGSIGMGKSTAAEMLRDMGIPVHDSDATVHGLLGPGGKAVSAVGGIFSAALKTDAEGKSYIDRQVLGRIVFGDRAKKKALEDILHPLVRAESDRFIAAAADRNQRMAALDIPLLFETGAEKRVDVTLCLSAPKEVQQQRVLARPGMTAEKFERIVAGQLPDAEKRKRSDYVVETNKSFDDMRKEIEQIVRSIESSKG